MSKKEILLTAGSVAVCLLLGEGAARIFLPPPARVNRPVVVQAAEVNKPGTRQTFQSMHRPDREIGWVLTGESAQYRNRLVDPQGALQYDVLYSVEGGRRKTSAAPHEGPELVAAGCSFTFGHGLNDQDTWPWLLQKRLPDYKVVNAGCMGYGTDQALLAAEREVRGRATPPRAVIFGFGDFQIERNRCTQGWMVTVYPFSKPQFALHSGKAEYQQQVRFWDGGWAARYSNLFGRLTNVAANRVYGIPSHEEARDLTAALLTGFGQRFQALGVRFLVVVLPYFADNSPQARADREFVMDRLKAAGIATLQPEFPREKNGGLNVRDFMVSRIDRHPNRRYTELLTGQLQPFLQAAGVVAP